MPTSPAIPPSEAIAARLAGTRFTDVRWFPELDSTNRYLVDEAAAGAGEGVVAVADVQHAGRGRLGRVWEAPAGSSLLVSVLVRPPADPTRMHLLTAAAALAAAEALAALASIDARLKWPNDLVVGDRKIAGLLAEARSGSAVVVGMGLNVQWDAFPPDLAATATACNLESDVPIARADLLVEWLTRLDGLLDLVGTDAGAVALRDAQAARSATLGRRVRVERAAGTLEGAATGLTVEGHLLVRTDDGADHEIAAGDVVHLRPA